MRALFSTYWEPNKTSALGVGIVGLGRISDIHIKALSEHKDVRIRAIADTNTSQLEEKKSIMPSVIAYTDYRKLLLDPSVDIVDILLPHYLHANAICDALRAGKHVICEKPIVTKPQDIHRIEQLTKKMKKNVYVKQYFRFSLLHEKLISLIQRGDIGKPYLVTCTYTTDSRREYLNPLSWRGNIREAGGGIFMDVGVHIIDYLQEIFGTPTSVCATVKKNFTPLNTKGEDLSVVTLEFRGGIVATISCSAVDTSYGFRWEKHFYGDEGSLHVLDNGKQKMELVTQQNSHEKNVETEKNWWELANIRAIHNCIDRIVAGDPPAISLSLARKTLQAVIGAYQSAKYGKRIYLQ